MPYRLLKLAEGLLGPVSQPPGIVAPSTHGATIMLQIRDHMQPLTHSLHPASVWPGAGPHRANLGGLPVLDDHQHLVGFLSEQDCIPALLTGS